MSSQLTLIFRFGRLERFWQAIPGIGPITASALVASVGDAQVFHNGRQFAAWLGLVPHQNSSGGKTKLLGISKRGDTYLRTLLIHGARSVLFSLKRNPDRANGWLARVADRRNPNIAAVALANKNGRIVWALLAHARDYQASFCSANSMATKVPLQIDNRQKTLDNFLTTDCTGVSQSDGITGKTGVDQT